MTEWNPAAYGRIAALQEAMAAEVLSLLTLAGNERVLDLGCGNGKVTAKVAALVQQGSVVGVDASTEMIAYALQKFGRTRDNLKFEVADIRALRFQDEFDLVISFNALHWIPRQADALRVVRAAMKPSGRAQLRLVPDGARKSLETVIDETRGSSRWADYFRGFHDPYLHMTAAQYTSLAESEGLHVLNLRVQDKAWDFGSAAAFQAFGMVTFVEWTKFLPEAERPAFVRDVLRRYGSVARDDRTFRFYQLDVSLSRDHQ